MPTQLKLKLYRKRAGLVGCRRFPVDDSLSFDTFLAAAEAAVGDDADVVDIVYVDDEGDKCSVTCDDELKIGLDLLGDVPTFHVVARAKPRPDHDFRELCVGVAPFPMLRVAVPVERRGRCGARKASRGPEAGGCPCGPKAGAKGAGDSKAACGDGATAEEGPCGGWKKCAEMAEKFAAMSDDEKMAKMAEMAERFASKVGADGAGGPAAWMAAAAEAFAAAQRAGAAGAAETTEAEQDAERVAVAESLETAAAGAPVPTAEPEGATALGLDQVRIAVQASLDDAAAPAPAPVEESKSEEPEWEAVLGPDDYTSALKALDAMGLVQRVGLDACMGAVAAHTTGGKVDLNAAVADVVAMIDK